MEEREKDNLANVDDNKSNGYSIANIDTSMNNDIIEISDDGEVDDIDYDQEYMTNVSNNLVSEVDKVLNGTVDEEETEPEETPEEKLPVIEDEKEEEVVEPKIEEPKEELPKVEEKEEVKEEPKKEEKSFEDLRR